MWRNGNSTLRFDTGAFYRHEMIILSTGACPGFLPMAFLRDGQGLTVRYETSGYLPLSGYRIDRTEDVLYLMEKVVLILHVCPEHLLAPERVRLSTSLVFYNKEKDDLKIAFLPRAVIPSGPVIHPESPNRPGDISIQNAASDPGQTAGIHASVGTPADLAPGGTPSPFLRELVGFLAQLKEDVSDQRTGFIARLARDLCYNCRDSSDMLRRIGLLRRELAELSSAPLRNC